MPSQAKRATARLSKNGKYMIVNFNGQSAILNANLVRYLFDVPYTRKDGTRISSTQIFPNETKCSIGLRPKGQTSPRVKSGARSARPLFLE